jgi:hypothetical protein
MGFAPLTEESVAAARDAVAAAERIRAAECGNGDRKQRGPNCRQRETEEQARREALTTAPTGRPQRRQQAWTARRRQLGHGLPPHLNPLGAALALLFGAGLPLTGWQQDIVAAVFELCLVAVIVIYELLGHVDSRDKSVGETACPRPAVASPAKATKPEKQGRQRQDICAAKAFSRRRRANGDQNFDARLPRLVRPNSPRAYAHFLTRLKSFAARSESRSMLVMVNTSIVSMCDLVRRRSRSCLPPFIET